MKRLFVTGGGGFVGSHTAEFYAKRGDEVIVYDNLSRASLLGRGDREITYNWDYLRKYPNIELVKGDIRDVKDVEKACKDVDIIVHAAAQTAVTTSLIEPGTDFEVNALGTFNVLEAARRSKIDPAIIYCSTNKVYGDNVNKIDVIEKEKRYDFEEKYKQGISETFPIDLCEHTPYGCSKLVGDLYTQDYSRVYGLDTATFRMSCIYGTRQFGFEDQGWVAWFAIATTTEKPITIYGDGKQVRDVLYVSDLIEAFDAFLRKRIKLSGEVFNIGGGAKNTLSLLELLDTLEHYTGKRSEIGFTNWRPSDQKVYISDISKAEEKLRWTPKISTREGVKKLIDWIIKKRQIFE